MSLYGSLCIGLGFICLFISFFVDSTWLLQLIVASVGLWITGLFIQLVKNNTPRQLNRKR